RFFSAQTGWVQGARDLLVTDDGGQHWQLRLRLGTDRGFQRVRFFDRDHLAGVVVVATASCVSTGLSTDTSRCATELYTTSDGGVHWQISPLTAADTSGRTVDYALFLDTHEGWRLKRTYRVSPGQDLLPETVVLYH